MRYLIVMLCVVMGASALACDFCSIYTATEAKESKPGVYAGVAEQFTHFATVQVDGNEVHNQVGQFLDSFITQFIVGDQFNSKLGLQVSIPYIHRSFRRPADTTVERG